MKSEVIIGTDLQEASNNCIEVGLSWAHFLKALPVVMHVHPSNLNESAAFLVDDKLESQFRALSQKIEDELQEKLEKQIIPFVKESQRIKTKIRFGDRAKAFVHRSVEKESKLIVLGWDDDLTKEKIWMASTIDRVIRASYSPVLVVKENKAKAPSNILFPFLLNMEFVDTLPWLKILAENFNSKITLLHLTKQS
ncbi:MAG: nucleotide-binding universal stress UspA family protein, partial [Bacteriovoracaceae bacterium]